MSTDPAARRLIDGLCSLLTLADEARQPGKRTGWTAEQIKDIIGGPTDDGLWHAAIVLGRKDD